MRFAATQHLEWAIANGTRPKPDCNLALSSVEDFPLNEIPWDPALVATDSHDPPAGRILREFLCQRYGVGPDQILVTSGSTGANYLASVALADRGDRVLVEEPVYEPLWRNLEAVGAEIVFVPRAADGTLDPDRFREKVNSRTKLIVTANLHNPTGRHTPPETVRELGRAAASVGALVLTDEVYLDGLFDGSPLPCAKAIGNGISTASFTKIYGLGILRGGWAVGPKEVIARMWRAYLYLGPFQSAAAAAVMVQAARMLPRLLERSRKRFEENFPVFRQWVEERPSLGWTKPDGGFVGLVKLPEGIDDWVFYERLARQESTWVTPGRFFRAPGHIRIGFGMSRAQLEEGLKRIDRVLKTR